MNSKPISTEEISMLPLLSVKSKRLSHRHGIKIWYI